MSTILEMVFSLVFVVFAVYEITKSVKRFISLESRVEFLEDSIACKDDESIK